MNKKEVFQRISEYTTNGETVAVATIIKTLGSTPREVGAKMVVQPTGKFVGTIGGGCGEAEVWQEAMSVFKTGKPKIMTVDLTEEAGVAEDKICGGKMEVFIELWPGKR